jgi:hypothetical protein
MDVEAHRSDDRFRRHTQVEGRVWTANIEQQRELKTT